MNEYIGSRSEEQHETLQSSLEVQESSTLKSASRMEDEAEEHQLQDEHEIRLVNKKDRNPQRKTYANSKQQRGNLTSRKPINDMNKSDAFHKQSHLEQFSDQKTDTDYDDFDLSGLELDKDTNFAQRMYQINKRSSTGDASSISWNAHPHAESLIRSDLSSQPDWKFNNTRNFKSLHGKRSMPLLRYEGSNVVPKSSNHQLRKVSSIMEMPFRITSSNISDQQDSMEELQDAEDGLDYDKNIRITLGDRQSLKKLINLANYMEVSHTASSGEAATKKSKMRLIRQGSGRRNRKAHLGSMRFNSLTSRWEGNEGDLERFETVLDRESHGPMASNPNKNANRTVIPGIINEVDIENIFTLNESWKERCHHEEHRWSRKINHWFNGRDEEDDFGDLVKQRHEIRTMIGRSLI